MKRLLAILALAAWAALPHAVSAAESCDSSVLGNPLSNSPVCACYHHGGYCDLSYPTSSSASSASCGTECQVANGEHYDSSSWDSEKDSCAGKGVASACTATNAMARLAAQKGDAGLAAAAAAISIGYATPQLNIPIPDLSFAEPLNVSGVVSSNFLGTYVAAVYKFLIGFAMTVAIVMTMVGGIQYVVGATTGEIGKAKERIKNAITGFTLLMSVYVILFIVNPNLTIFPNLQLLTVPAAPEEYEEDYVNGGSVATSFGTPDGLNITGAGKMKIPEELVSSVESAAAGMGKYGLGISVSSSFRSLADQIKLIYTNCQNPPGSKTCNPKPGRPTTCILRDNNGANCPHTTGRALDVWGTRDGGTQCILQKACLADKEACRRDACQGQLIAEMKAAGFCNLESEPWHFEKPKMSSTCN